MKPKKLSYYVRYYNIYLLLYLWCKDNTFFYNKLSLDVVLIKF